MFLLLRLKGQVNTINNKHVKNKTQRHFVLLLLRLKGQVNTISNKHVKNKTRRDLRGVAPDIGKSSGIHRKSGSGVSSQLCKKRCLEGLKTSFWHPCLFANMQTFGEVYGRDIQTGFSQYRDSLCLCGPLSNCRSEYFTHHFANFTGILGQSSCILIETHESHCSQRPPRTPFCSAELCGNATVSSRILTSFPTPENNLYIKTYLIS